MNSQSNTHNNSKSIKHENSQHQLNVILSDIETNYDPSQIELCAAIRPERPPDVTTATPYNKIKPTSKSKGKQPTLARKVVTRSHLEEVQPVSNQQNTSQHDINMDTDLPIQDRETIKQKRTRTKSEPTSIQYDIVSDVMKQKADIEIGELIQVAPTLRRKLISECRPKRISTKQQQQEQRQPMIQALDIVDDELNTTAAHSTVYINDKKIKTLVDCGAAKTCMSKELADMLGLEIDAPSESVFTLGNNSKQPALGIIYDVPIEAPIG
ncbi:hypothetical protein G6F39_012615 [Rhizopus arrhizus]|nr:hypothetical protein G6F39_012615 [Rhizopus arrhizus]